MRIALISPYALGVPGGVSVHIASLAAALRQRGHDVTRIAPAYGGAILDPDVVPIGRPVPVPSSGSTARITLSPFLWRDVSSVLERGRFDVLHVHEPLTPALPMYFLRPKRALVIGTFHAAHDGGDSRYSLARHPLRVLAGRLDGRTAVSPSAARLVERYFPGEYRIIPNGVDRARFGTPAALPAAFESLPERYILFVGRLERRKGLAALLQAFTRIQSTDADLGLVVIGHGPRRERYETWVRERGLPNVHFLGRVGNEDLAPLYQHALVYCAPNTGNESFGLVLVEAMAAGTPVVASDIEGFRDVLGHGHFGVLVPPQDPVALAEALTRLVRDGDLRARYVAAGRERAEEFDWERVVGQVLDFYEQMFERKRRGGSAV